MGVEEVTVRIVSKARYDQQYFVQLPLTSLPPLAQSSVRVQPRLLGLGSNNLSYCIGGAWQHWWQAFQLPASLPQPYNDNQRYGIAPGWGFAEVRESTIPLLKAGTWLYGFLPLSAHPIDLELQQSGTVATHWKDITTSRDKLLPLYRRYMVVEDPLSTKNLLTSAYTVTLPWLMGYLFNRFAFASQPEDLPISPAPDFGVPWPAGSEDLRSALVVALGAGSKTSRTFVQQLATNRIPSSGPKALLEVSSNTNSIVPGLNPSFEHRITTYDNVVSQDALTWISSLEINRIIVCDFGSRDDINEKLTLYLREQLSGIKVDIVFIGLQSKVYTTEERAALDTRAEALQGVLMSTSGMQEEAIKQRGEAAFFEEQGKEFECVVRSELARNKGTADEGTILGVKLAWRQGLRGSSGVQGLEQAWTDVSRGRVSGSEGLVIRL